MNNIYNNRRTSLLKHITEPGYVVHNPADLLYMTGTGLDGFIMLVTRRKTYAFTSKMLEEQLRRLLPGVAIVAGTRLYADLIEKCQTLGIKSVAVDASYLSYSAARILKKSLKVVEYPGLGENMRMVKGSDEIRAIRRACTIAAQGVRYARRIIKPGMTEIEIYFKIEEFFARNRVVQSFPTIVASGPNSANPHHVSGSRKIRKNDVVLIDMGCRYQGYCSDLTRTFFLGRITKLQQQVFSLVKRAQNSAINAISVGSEPVLLDAQARDIISQGGFGDKFIHSTGHGVGIAVHEMPRVAPGAKQVTLKPGMVITVEPGIYIPGKFGVRIEDTVLVTKKGKEVLTV